MRPPHFVVKRGQVSLGLTWPSFPAKKHVGRPTRQEAWVERVQRALRADERDSVYALSSLEVPPCWRPGLGLESPCEADVAAITVKTREHEQNVDREQDGPPKPKRVKVQLPPEAVQWFLVWSAHMWEHHGWPQAQSLGTAASWPPEVFGGINRSSIYRWKLSARDLQGALPICSRAVNCTPTNTARTELHSMITFLKAQDCTSLCP